MRLQPTKKPDVAGRYSYTVRVNRTDLDRVYRLAEERGQKLAALCDECVAAYLAAMDAGERIPIIPTAIGGAHRPFNIRLRPDLHTLARDVAVRESWAMTYVLATALHYGLDRLERGDAATESPAKG